MILKRLKSNSSVSLILVPIVSLALWVKSIQQPLAYDFYPGEQENVLFALFFQLVKNSDLAQVVSGILLAVALAYLMQLVNDRYMFIRIKSKLPALLFAIVIGGIVPMHTLHPVYFGAVFVLLAVYRLFSAFEIKRPYSLVFDVGFLLGIGALFYLNLLVLLPAFMIGIVILGREAGWREFVIMPMGFFLPFIFALSFMALKNQFLETIAIFQENIITPVNHFQSNIPLQVYVVTLVLLTIAGSVGMFKQYDTKKISSRKYFTVFFWIFIFSLASFVFMPVTSHEMLVITAIPVTYLIANFFVFMKSRFWSELLFILLLVIVVSMQFSFNIFNG
ncbi:DUF6427 family protein [uncultured Draconibacterium sp.]|uniref:DUF6427 family protein n=1 Tax=uncultured Draconibacterium sp. TaxID=1573823 RepID=UPI0025DA5A79|nr:DUF6427 family protein [uncultured Draconibacterium sp.]